MDKDPFEDQLRDLPWRQAPSGLGERLFGDGAPSQRTLIQRIDCQRVQLSWAAALMLLVGALGFVVGHRSAKPGPLAEFEFHVIERGLEQNFFDLSFQGPDLWPDSVELNVVPVTYEP